MPLLFARAKLKSLMYDCQFFLVRAFNRTGINCQYSPVEEIQFEIWDSRIFAPTAIYSIYQAAIERYAFARSQKRDKTATTNNITGNYKPRQNIFIFVIEVSKQIQSSIERRQYQVFYLKKNIF